MASRSVRLLPHNDSVCGWQEIATRNFPVRRLESRMTADWLIIGGGFAGLSAARQLQARCPDDTIVLLEANCIGDGASGRNSGFMIDVPHNIASTNYAVGSTAASSAEMILNRFAIDFAADAAREYDMGVDTFDRCGKVNAAASPRGQRLNSAFADGLAAQDEPFETLDRMQMRELVGSDYYRGGIYTPGTAMIQPAAYVTAFARGLKDRIALLEQSPVTKLERRDGLWHASSDHGSVQAPKVIMAVNGFLRYFGYYRHAFMPIYTFASMTEPFRDEDLPPPHRGQPKWALLPADPMGATFRKITNADGARIIARTHFGYARHYRLPHGMLHRAVRRQRKAFDNRFPALRDLPMAYTWGGALCLSINHVPALGEIDEGMYSACCCNGLGSIKSTLAGILAVDLATGQDNPLIERYASEAPKRLPPSWLLGPVVNTVATWRELRAGKEA